MFNLKFSYHINKTSRGINVKIEGDMKYNDFVVDQIKPSIEADVHKSLNKFGQSLHAGLQSC